MFAVPRIPTHPHIHTHTSTTARGGDTRHLPRFGALGSFFGLLAFLAGAAFLALPASRFLFFAEAAAPPPPPSSSLSLSSLLFASPERLSSSEEDSPPASLKSESSDSSSSSSSEPPWVLGVGPRVRISTMQEEYDVCACVRG